MVVGEILPEAFKDQVAQPWYDAFPRYLYFSFVTLTTLGFGDTTPVEPLAQFLVYVEAVAGQLYIAILVASVVGMGIAKTANQAVHQQKKDNKYTIKTISKE